ncbi:hypothetical protein CEE36_06565 [candidate division TA06 bacterium B3_TA06]|uniref:Gingipain domain-containing protein n=1 Tax=candidate division TA06 bacterium B3_TA06 TaxID=2012487 RepID=A0A532V6C6_UNCT6|nr:MAG: hypothetical protein CEE36_06565 [candidate division TA06 bacterium B3_TA06]
MYMIKILIFFGLLVPLTLPPSVVAAEEIPLCSQEGSMVFALDMPSFEFVTLENGETRIIMEGASYRQVPGYPRLPKLTYTFALPPAGEVVEVEVRGARFPLEGTYLIEASPPRLPRSASVDVTEKLYSIYEENRVRVYSGEEKLSEELGKINAKAERREYSLVTVTLCPFFYDPVSGALSAASDVTVRIDYAPVSEEHVQFIESFMEKGTLYEDVPECIYNKEQAREWYRPSERLLASPRMIILTTDDLKPHVNRYVSWRESTGFDVRVVTLEEITESTEGVDTQQKIRNWLREHAADYHYLLIIGHHWDIPMRTLTLFNNNDDPFNNPDIAPHPSDIYYGDLSKPDFESWDIDGDGYYGEIEDWEGTGDVMDEPDLEMELHMGRINTLLAQKISNTLERTWLFEDSKDLTYKKRSVLAAGILFYFSLEDKDDGGAWFMEYLMDSRVLTPSLATTLYEKEGDNPSDYDCDLPLTQDNLVATLANADVGIFVENNHGVSDRFVRCVWYDDNEDGEAQDSELDWPPGLTSGDAPNLNHTNPNVAFLMSCLNGKPETGTCLAQALLNEGSVGVVAHTRAAWGSFWEEPGDEGDYDLFYYQLKAYLAENNTYDYVIGDAVSAGRAQYWNQVNWFGDYYNAYGQVLYGDPALRHMGREGTIPTAVAETIAEKTPTALNVNADHVVRFSLPEPTDVRIEVWDAAGRKVQTLLEDHSSAGTHTLSWDSSGLPSGAYFITLRTKAITRTAKAVVIQ